MAFEAGPYRDLEELVGPGAILVDARRAMRPRGIENGRGPALFDVARERAEKVVDALEQPMVRARRRERGRLARRNFRAAL